MLSGAAAARTGVESNSSRMNSVVVFALFASQVSAETPAQIWAEFKAKRDAFPGFHQEFDVSHVQQTSHGPHSIKRQVVLDATPAEWLERTMSGTGNYLVLFDGKQHLWLEEGGAEYVRLKEASDVPGPYRLDAPDWSRATIEQNRPCGIPGVADVCVLIELPLKGWAKADYPSVVSQK